MTTKRAWAIRPIHPGEMLCEDVLPALGRSKKEIAEHELGDASGGPIGRWL